MKLDEIPDEREIPAARAAALKALLSTVAGQTTHPGRKAAVIGGVVVIAGAVAAGGVVATGAGGPSNRRPGAVPPHARGGQQR